MITFSIDPAIHGCGCALFRDGVLVAAGYARNEVKDGDIVRRCAASARAALNWLYSVAEFTEVDRLIVELPQIYQRGANKSKGDPNKNVLPLAMVDAALAALLPYAEVHEFQPHAWKGGTSKPERSYDAGGREIAYVIKDKVKARLSSEELARVDWTKSIERSWDVADSIGVGFTFLGRFERARVFARE